MTDLTRKLPDEIKVWHSHEDLDHLGAWATTRYPEEAVAYVPKTALAEAQGQIPRFPDHMAKIVAAKNADLPERLTALVTALEAIPEDMKQYQWRADQKQSFGSKWVRCISGDNGRGMGLQAIAEVVSHLEVADFIAAANPDTISLLINALAEAQAAQAGVVREACEAVSAGYAAWAAKPHNAKWVRRIDGTPIPNDLLVCIQTAVRALAPADGLALVRELRAERDALKKRLISPDPYEDTAHPDDHAVNRFAAVMKGKLAVKRLQGRGGWQEPEVPNGYLSRMLREHVDKGDPVDVANLAMMIHQRGERIAPENEGASCKAIDDAEAERDRLAAANAALEAKVAGLVDALRKHHEWHLSQDRDGNAWGIDPVDAYSESGLCEETCAALATQEAGK